MVIPLWFGISLAITIVHTIEEVQGKIWKTINIPASFYFAFQVFVVILSWLAIVEYQFSWLFVIVRIVDCIGTHWLLQKPGIKTSPLLLLDVIYLTIRI